MLNILPDAPNPSLDELLQNAGEATGLPPPPLEGISPQWVPGWIRWPLRAVLLPFILLDLAAQQFAKMLIRPPLRKTGSCLKRGHCCHYILVPECKGLLGIVYYFWNTQILGFYPRTRQVHEAEGKRVLVMGCRYLRQNGSCSHYHLRPLVCRKWPMIEYFGYPRILKGCGFKAVDRFHN
jgi:hypothetical protein